jgi:hypothetical protein
MHASSRSKITTRALRFVGALVAIWKHEIKRASRRQVAVELGCRDEAARASRISSLVSKPLR